MLLIHESSGKLPSMYVTCAAVQLARETSRRNFCDHCLRFVSFYPRAQFRILVGGTGRNVPPLFHSVPGFSNDPEVPNPRRSVPHKPCLHVSCNLGMRQEPGSASLPCTTVAVHRGAGAKKDSMRFCAIPLWITAGSFISHLVSDTH